MSNFPNFQATFPLKMCLYASVGPLRAPIWTAYPLLVRMHPAVLSSPEATVGGDILCCHLPLGFLVPYMKRVRGVPLGVFLFLLFWIQQQSYLSLGVLNELPQVLSQYAP